MRARRPRVVVRRRARGTHKGAGLGMAATGRAAALRGMTCITFKNGFVEQDWKIVGAALESWLIGRYRSATRP